ncbi:hypothetical protein [Pseudocolwellia agarivorans]|uniref:hypothetical protein n=1 Tax=Pseudocolwellia agarivorans TaxID=1911682 RepID=UPI0009868DAE|nr:hypothetical protein [Pseudocolwellia agarivorans]
MCSSPKPKTQVKGTKSVGSSGSILSSISTESRIRFSERANLAQERRDQIKLEEKQKALRLQAIHKKNEKRLLKNKQSRLSYWLLSASLKEIIQLLFLGKTKSI